MRNDPQASRILGELSTLFGRQLHIGERISAGRTGARVEIAPRDGAPLAAPERRLLDEVAELLQRNSALRREYAALDQRLRFIERENAELRTQNRALAEQSSRDTLTGLFTRSYLVETLEAEMNRALRSGSSVAVLMLDIDNLNGINKRYGSEAGDLVIQNIAQVLRDSCRVYDVPARYGGEEFCLMLPESRVDSTATVAERLRRKIESTAIVTKEASISITSSIGIASLESIPDEALLGASSLLERADRALNIAKAQGKNRVETWSGAMALRGAEAAH